jgi:hypothetical protein
MQAHTGLEEFTKTLRTSAQFELSVSSRTLQNIIFVPNEIHPKYKSMIQIYSTFTSKLKQKTKKRCKITDTQHDAQMHLTATTT